MKKLRHPKTRWSRRFQVALVSIRHAAMKAQSRFFVSCLFFSVWLPLGAQDLPPPPGNLFLTGGASGSFNSQTQFSTEEIGGLTYSSEHFDLHTLLEMNNDKRFGSDTIYLSSTNNLGNYLLVDQGDVVVKGMGMALQAGRFRPEDEIDSPYSLVLNGTGKILGGNSWDADTSTLVNTNILSSNGMKFSYQLGPFTYSSEWISLNDQSNFGSVAATPPAWQYTWNGTNWVQNGTGFPDRGTDIHNFIYHSGPWRVGIQDQSIYSGRNFDSEYFFSPMPQYFTEYLRSIGGRPWTAGNELDKYMMGFFADWKQDGRDAYVQFQMADFNLHFLDASVFPNNPAKFAWSAGGHVTNDWGRWGFFHAGATKYMYEAMPATPGSEAVRDVGNSYYPDMVYNLNGTFVPVDLQTSQVGYSNGENNLAFLVTWDRNFSQDRLHLGSSLEFILAGSNSSANPWQGDTSTPSSDLGTQLLNDPVLQKTLQTEFRADYALDNWTFSAHLTLGVAFNVLQLQTPANYNNGTPTNGISVLNSLIDVWVPSDQNQGIMNFVLAVKYSFDASAILKQEN